jgi:hypothetical protein
LGASKGFKIQETMILILPNDLISGVLFTPAEFIGWGSNIFQN